MKTKKYNVYVSLKKSVLDPEGDTIKSSLNQMGYSFVEGVRVFKGFEVEIDEATHEDQLTELTEKLLVNPVIEQFKIEKSN